jgi:DNA polymerase elongation subunit (family B)
MEIFRDKPKKYSNKQDFIFQAVEWIGEDVISDEFDNDDDSQPDKLQEDGKYKVVVYGITQHSESVAVILEDYEPYFYIRVPYELQGKFTKKMLNSLHSEIKFKVWSKTIDYKDSIVAKEILERKEFYGFTNDKPIQFIRFRFRSIGAMRSYSRLFQEPLKVGTIHTKPLYYQLYESNIDPLLRLCHIQNVLPVGWIKLPAGKYDVVPRTGREYRTQYEFHTTWRNIEPVNIPDIGPMVVASFDIECVSEDGSFPKADRPNDCIIQIGTTCHYHGQKDCFLRHIITLGKSDEIEGAMVESYETEEEVLLAWTNFMQRLDPDIITGYNIWGFDMKYMFERAQLLGIQEGFCQLGRNKEKTSDLVEKSLQSSALGQNFFYILEMEGRIQFDIMKVVQRDYKLDMYKLDFVAEHFLGSNKVDLGPKELFAKFRAGGAQNIKDIAVYCIQDCELCNRLTNKLEILTNNVGMGNVCHVPLYWLFLRGQGVKIYSLVARQARLEGFLLKLQRKGKEEDKGYEGAVVLVATPGVYMTPISVLDYASLYPSSMISENISHDSIVFYKVYDNSGNIVNIQNEKPGWYSLPEYRMNDDPSSTKKLDRYFKDLGYKTNYIESVNYEGYYEDLTKKLDETNYEYEKTVGGKKILGKTLCCFVDKGEKKSVIPRILQDLLWARRVTRASAFYKVFHMKDGMQIDGDFLKKPDEDPEYYHIAEYKQKAMKLLKKDVVKYEDKYNEFQQKVLDGLQLAYKITANSLYGQVGAPTSPIYFKELASSTTATGRKMLQIAKDSAESKYPGAVAVYGDSVTGDTPLLLRNNNGAVVIKTIEQLSQEWSAYDGFKAGESNRREKQQAPCDLEIWVKDKWAKIHRVIRHKTQKRIYRVNTHQGCVDVTEDHSLINQCGTIIKAGECTVGETSLMHGFPVEFPEIESKKIVPITWDFSSAIPDHVLNGPLEERNFFFRVLCKFNLENFEIKVWGKIAAQGVYYLAKSIGINDISIGLSDENPNFYYIRNGFSQVENPNIIKNIIDLGVCSEDIFVYDIETSVGLFNSGVGSIVVKNTDSVFLSFHKYWENELGLRLEGVDALKKSIELAMECGNYITKLLKKPQELEYEKTFYPFIQLAKKRYVANKYEHDPHKFKENSMGIVLKRRDNCQLTKIIYGGIIKIILNDRDIKKAERFFKDKVNELLTGSADMSDLVITKTLRMNYVNPASIAHAALADRMAKRDPGNKPQSNDRIPFVFIQKEVKKGEKVLQGDKVEHPQYIKENPGICKPDFMYYLEHQIKTPCIQLFALELEQLDGYRANWMDERILERLKEKGKNEKDIEDKRITLREAEAEKLLIGEIVQTYENKISRTQLITNFFTKRGKDELHDEFMTMKPIKKKLDPIGIDSIKKKVEDKKEEVQDFRDEILNVDDKVLKRLAKIKAEKKTASTAAAAAKKPAATPRKKSLKDS